METSTKFEALDRTAARNFADAARSAGVRRIVYLGGLGSGDGLSPHLASRQEVGAILRSSGVPKIDFRASIVIGSGSASDELVRALVETLPLVIAPPSVSTHRELGRGRVRPGRARLPHQALEKLAAAPAAVARLWGKPATLLWPASSTNPTYSSNHSRADSVASLRRGSHGQVMSGSRRLSRAPGRPAQPGRSGWCRRHGGRGSCGFQAQLDRSARYGNVAKTGSPSPMALSRK